VETTREAELMNMRQKYDEFYDEKRSSFGDQPSSELKRHWNEVETSGRALDLGCGDGRNTLFVAGKGMSVTAVDISGVGLDKLHERILTEDLQQKVQVMRCDVRDFPFRLSSYDLVVAVTLFDHLPAEDILPIFPKITDSMKPNGLLYTKVHTVDDPGYRHDTQRQSELADLIRYYFQRNELLRMVMDRLHVIWYEEKSERDASHGKPHWHAFSKILARKTAD
jgi:tellurite methyltransferase